MLRTCVYVGGGGTYGHVHGQLALGSRSGRSLGLAPRLRERTPVARKILHLSCFTPSACTRRRRARRARRCGLAFGARALDSGSVLGARARARTRTRGSRPHAWAMRSQQSSGLACFPYSAACAGRSVASCFTPYTRSVPGSVEPMRWTASDGEPTAIAGHRCPPLGPSEGDVNEKLEKTEEEIGQTEAVEKKGKMLQEEVCDRRRLQKEAGMRSPPLIVWRTCHQTETHSARRSLHKYRRKERADYSLDG